VRFIGELKSFRSPPLVLRDFSLGRPQWQLPFSFYIRVTSGAFATASVVYLHNKAKKETSEIYLNIKAPRRGHAT
jgi:hypothetical protein